MPTPFEQWFDGDFERRIRATRGEPGLLSSGLPITAASWDRRAGYLLWVSLGRPSAAPVQAADSLGSLLG